jgi:hypothetical protein
LAQRQRAARALYRTGSEAIGKRWADAYANRGTGGVGERDWRGLMLLEATLGIFSSAGVAKESWPHLSTVAELVAQLIPDVEAAPLVKDGMGQLLNDVGPWSKRWRRRVAAKLSAGS